MAKLSEQIKDAARRAASLPDEAAGGALEQAKKHKAAAAGAVAGFAVAGPVGAAAGGALGEASAKFVSRLAEGLKAFQESPELTPEIAVQRIKEPGFFGKAMEVLPAGLVEAATGKRPIGKKQREAQTAAQYEVRFAQVIHHIEKLPPEQQNEIRVQLLEKGKIAGPEAAAAHYILQKLDVEYQKTVIAQEEEKQKQLTAEVHQKRAEANSYQGSQSNELKAERAKYEARVQAYETFLANIQKAKNPAEVQQAIQEAKAQITGGVEEAQQQNLAKEKKYLKSLSTWFGKGINYLNANPDLAESHLQDFEIYLANQSKDIRFKLEAAKKQNTEITTQLQAGKETTDTAKVETEMPDEWKEAKRKQDEAKAALAQLSAGGANADARTQVIILRHEGANTRTIGDYQAEYNRVQNALGAKASRGKIEAEIDRTKGREFRERAETARKENSTIQGVRTGFAHGGNTEALTYLNSLTVTQQQEMDKHKQKQAELEKKYTTRKPLTDDEVAQALGSEYQELWRRNKELTKSLDYVKQQRANIGPTGDYRRIAGRIRNIAQSEQAVLMAQMGELAIKSGAKTTAPDHELVKYLDGLEAHLVQSYQGRLKTDNLQTAIKKEMFHEKHGESEFQKSLRESRERLDALKGDPEKKLEAAEKEKAESAKKLKATQERQAALVPALQASEKYIEGVYGKDFLARVEARQEQIATVREDLALLDTAVDHLTGKTPEAKAQRAVDIAQKRREAIETIQTDYKEKELRKLLQDLRNAGLEIADEDAALDEMKRVAASNQGRSFLGIFAALLQSLVALRPQSV